MTREGSPEGAMEAQSTPAPFALPVKVSPLSDDLLAWVEDSRGYSFASFAGVSDNLERAIFTARAVNEWAGLRKAVYDLVVMYSEVSPYGQSPVVERARRLLAPTPAAPAPAGGAA